jgi:putative thiazole/oxazole-modified microcin (TOMM)-like peptide
MNDAAVVTTAQIEHNWRFAELTARAWLEQELAARYAEDPCAVLAEFGIALADPQAAPALPADPGEELVIGDLDRAADVAPFTICTAGMGTAAVGGRAGA